MIYVVSNSSKKCFIALNKFFANQINSSYTHYDDTELNFITLIDVMKKKYILIVDCKADNSISMTYAGKHLKQITCSDDEFDHSLDLIIEMFKEENEIS